MIIRNNIPSQNAGRSLKLNNTAITKNLEKLSTGLNINRAADDAAGLAISEKMRGQIRGLERGRENIKDGKSLIETADGYLEEITAVTHRIRELAVQASNGTYDASDRQQIQMEIDQLVTEIDQMTSSAEFNKIKLFRGEVQEILYAPATFETITPKDPAYIYANKEFGDLGDVKIANGTQAEQTIPATSTHLAALNASQNFPREGVFIISVGIPGPPAQSRDAVLDFGDLNGTGSLLDGNFSLADFREFFMGENTGTDPVTGAAIYANGAFSDWINAGELFFEVTDAGAITVKTTGLGGSQASVNIGATSTVPSGKILANSAIFGASASSYSSLSSAIRTTYQVTSQAELDALRATASTNAALWAAIPARTFTYRVEERGLNPNWPQSSSTQWLWPPSGGQTNGTQSWTTNQSATLQDFNALIQGQRNSGLFNSIGNIGMSLTVDREGFVYVSFSNYTASQNTANYPSPDHRVTFGTISTNSYYAPQTSTYLPYVTSNYAAKVSDEIGTLDITISNIPNSASSKSVSVSVDFSSNTVKMGSETRTFTTAAEMAAQIEELLNHSSNHPVPLPNFTHPTLPAGNTNPIYDPAYPVARVFIDSSGNLTIRAAERMLSISVTEKQSDRPMFVNGRTVTSGTNQSHILQIEGTPPVNVTIAPGDYGTNINEFITRNKAAFEPHYILRADDSGKSLVVESVAKGSAIDVRNIRFISPTPTTPSNLLSFLGFDSLSYNSPTWFVDGISHPSYDRELPRAVAGVDMGAKPLWIQGGANRGEGLYILLPYLSASRLRFSEYEIPAAAKEAGITFDTSGKTQRALSVATVEDANSAINIVDSAIKIITAERVNFGATLNELEHMMSYVGNTHENLSSSESKIRDLDMAKEMMGFTKNNILAQAAQSMLAQSNQLPQGILSLLQ